MTDIDETEQLRAALREELACLWSDLAHETQWAHNGRWSVACDNRLMRITAITELVGPVRWEDMPYELLRDGSGLYRRLHAEMGAAVEVDEAGLAEYLRQMKEQQ